MGECVEGDVGWSRRNTDVVPCSSPHTSQIVGVVPYVSADDSFPGDQALDQLGEEKCYAAFEAFVGINYEDSIWYMTAWYPSAETWEADDRTVICALEAENGEPIVGSKEGVAE